jgi:hypothetical protein
LWIYPTVSAPSVQRALKVKARPRTVLDSMTQTAQRA